MRTKSNNRKHDNERVQGRTGGKRQGGRWSPCSCPCDLQQINFKFSGKKTPDRYSICYEPNGVLTSGRLYSTVVYDVSFTTGMSRVRITTLRVHKATVLSDYTTPVPPAGWHQPGTPTSPPLLPPVMDPGGTPVACGGCGEPNLDLDKDAAQPATKVLLRYTRFIFH